MIKKIYGFKAEGVRSRGRQEEKSGGMERWCSASNEPGRIVKGVYEVE